ncbi:MAG: glutaminyl-peptide cyclotransferase [Acidimicrobiia bacterium]
MKPTARCSLGLLGVAAGMALSPQPLAQSGAVAQGPNPVVYGYRVIEAYPHDSRAFTQGFIYRDGFFYESTGLQGHSSLRKVRIETGEVLQQHAIDSRYFAEGLTDWAGRLIQLTWQTNVGFVYDLSTFQLERTFNYSGEGWGLTHDRTRLIMSDGSANLRFLNPKTFQETGRLVVKDRGVPVKDLNELEFVRGEIYANVWSTDRIARISPLSGQVTGWIDLRGLMSQVYQLDRDAVLNGIAYDVARDRLFVTGKLWPKVFEIRLTRHH